MQSDYERNYLLMNAHDKSAFCFLVSVVNTNAYDDTTKTASECFLTWDILEDAMPFLTQPNFIYAVGGRVGSNIDIDSVLRYDTTTNVWSSVASMPKKRYRHGVCIHGNFLYAVGGNDGSNPLDSVLRYDTTTNTWSSVASMPTIRMCHGVCIHGNFIFAVGGHDGSGVLDSVLRYDTTTNVWSSVASMPKKRMCHGVCIIGNFMYVVGGCVDTLYGGYTYLDSVIRYDITSNVWSSVASMPTNWSGPAVI